MTDLEDAWEDVPTGEPPVGAILAAGRARRRQQRRRPVMAAGGVAALAAAFATGVVVSDPGSLPPTTADVRPVAFQADLVPATDCEDLLAVYRARGLELVNAWGWGPGYPGAYATLDTASLSTARTGALTEQGSSATGTNVQEEGVDEPDTVKTNGSLVVRLRGSKLEVYDVTGRTPVLSGSVRLPRFTDGRILLVGDQVVAIGSDVTRARQGSTVVTVSIDDPADPVIVNTTTYTSRVVTARRHGSAIRLVLAEGLPALDFTDPEAGKISEAEALSRNRHVVESTTITDWLPQYNAGAGARRLVPCDQVAVPDDSPGLDTVSIVGFTPGETEPSAIALAGSVSIAYASADRLYLSDQQQRWHCATCDWFGPRAVGPTHLYEFEFDGVDAIHVASGEIEGTVKDRWSMDEADGVLRVAIGPSSETGDSNSLVTLRRQGQRLQEIGRLDKIGVSEDIKAVRWFDDLAVVVTFRQTDPLYTIDLSRPEEPTLRGALKIPGFSSYLHPVSDDLLLGVGYADASATRVKIALYDASDLADVRQTSAVDLGQGHALAPDDPRAFTWLPKAHTALTVVQKGNEVFAAEINVDRDELTQHLTYIESSADAHLVRTLPLPDGRVVLVTGEDVRFFDLS